MGSLGRDNSRSYLGGSASVPVSKHHRLKGGTTKVTWLVLTEGSSVENYLTRKLKLVVNRDKSRICSTNGVEFLSYQFHGYGGQIRVSPKSIFGVG